MYRRFASLLLIDCAMCLLKYFIQFILWISYNNIFKTAIDNIYCNLYYLFHAIDFKKQMYNSDSVIIFKNENTNCQTETTLGTNLKCIKLLLLLYFASNSFFNIQWWTLCVIVDILAVFLIIVPLKTKWKFW